jgi:hypothetical protein
MSSPVSSRGTFGDYSARGGGPNVAQAPLSGRRGALLRDVSQAREERPVDTIAVARRLAEKLAA